MSRTDEDIRGSARSSTPRSSLLAFGLLGLVIWQNRDKIREVFSRPLDLQPARAGAGDLPVSA